MGGVDVRNSASTFLMEKTYGSNTVSTKDSCHHGESMMNVNDATTASTKEITTPRKAPKAVPNVVSTPDKLSKEIARATTALTTDDKSRTAKNIAIWPSINCIFGFKSNPEKSGATKLP